MPVYLQNIFKRLSLMMSLIMTIMICAVAYANADGDYKEGKAAYDRGDVITAMDLLNRSANAGSVQAMLLLGYILDKSEENKAAFDMYQRAAKLGNGEAMFSVGVMYANGEGTERNLEQAVKMMEQSVEAGYGKATVTLALSYLEGSMGLTKSREKAIEWLNKGIEMGFEPAQRELERLSEKNRDESNQ